MKSDSLNATEAYSAARSTHPRVSLQDMKDNIGAEYYSTLAEALAGMPTSPDYHLDKFTLCTLVMKNGFIVIGKSAPASPENFDAEKGRTFAYEDAIRQLWPLEGYALRDRLSAVTA